MFRIASDPLGYVDDQTHRFEPRRQIETLLSIEQLFRDVQSISIHERDQHVRRNLMFGVLDTLEGMGLLNFQKMADLDRAERTLNQLSQRIPPAAAEVLLPRARAAVDALREVQDGFFLPLRVGPDGVRLPGKHGREQVNSRAKAARDWLRVLRNASHGFGGDARTAREEALLAAQRVLLI